MQKVYQIRQIQYEFSFSFLESLLNKRMMDMQHIASGVEIEMHKM